MILKISLRTETESARRMQEALYSNIDMELGAGGDSVRVNAMVLTAERKGDAIEFILALRRATQEEAL
jgi:hypothetical protein